MLSKATIPFFRQLLQRTRQVVFLYHISKRHFYANAAFEEMFGLSSTNVNEDASHLLAVIHPDDQPYVIAYYMDLLSGQTEKTIEFRLIVPEQQEKWYV